MSPSRRSSRPLPLARALDAHCASLLGCRRCSHAPGVVPIVARTRAPRAMLVGQAPGKTEAGGGRPFAGRAGATLFKWLHGVGIDEAQAREWLYISAITRCYPGPHPSGRGDRVPDPREQAKCGDWLDAELRIIRPPLIVLVGRLAIGRFLGARPLDELVGQEHAVAHAGGTSVAVPLPHPSGASSWIHAPDHRVLLDRALGLIRDRLVSDAVVAARSVA
jgi:uracil-DNA glycosylase